MCSLLNKESLWIDHPHIATQSASTRHKSSNWAASHQMNSQDVHLLLFPFEGLDKSSHPSTQIQQVAIRIHREVALCFSDELVGYITYIIPPTLCAPQPPQGNTSQST